LAGSPVNLLAVGVAQADAHAVVGMPSVVSTVFTSERQPRTSCGDLFLGAEEVGVVLGEAADAGHAVELAGLLPAIDGAELGEAHGQVAVGVRLRGEDLDVVRAVHRLQQEAVDELVVGQDAVLGDRLLAGALVDLLGEVGGDGLDAVRHLGAGAAGGDELVEVVALDDRRELRVLVVGEVAGGLVEREAADVRREDL
jgi:hypothetical protein